MKKKTKKKNSSYVHLRLLSTTEHHSVKKCARCGRDHRDLLFRQFLGKSPRIGGRAYNWWATCPTTGDPILLAKY